MKDPQTCCRGWRTRAAVYQHTRAEGAKAIAAHRFVQLPCGHWTRVLATTPELAK